MQRWEDSLNRCHPLWPCCAAPQWWHAAHGVPMNRAGLTKDHIVWIKTRLPQKEKTPHPVNQIKTKCCIRQIRLGGVRAFTAEVSGGVGGGSSLPPPTQLNLLALLLIKLVIILHRCAELSSRAIVFFDPCDRWGTHFFFCARSHRQLLRDGPAPGW